MERRLETISYTGMAFLGAYLSAYQKLISEITNEFSGNNILAGELISAHFAGLFLGPLAAGALSDRIGKKPVIILSYLFFIVGILIILLRGSISVFCLGILFAGMAFGSLEMGISAALADMKSAEMGRRLIISQFFFCFGTVCGPFVASAFLDALGGWKPLYLVWIVFCLMMTFAHVYMAYPVELGIKEKNTGPKPEKLFTPVFLLICISIFIYVGVEEGLAFWMTSYMKEIRMPALVALVALPAFWSGMTVGKLMFLRKIKKPAITVAACATVASVTTLLFSMNPGPAAAMAILFVIGFVLSGIFPLIMAMAGNAARGQTGKAFGIMMSCCAAGGLTVPFLMGLVSEYYDLGASVLVCSGLAFLLVAAILNVRKRLDLLDSAS